MTKRREPLTYENTLASVAAVIGWDNCAAICGVTERAIRNWSEPDTQSGIRMIDAERLDRAVIASGGSHPPFHRLFGLRLDIAAQELAKIDIANAAANAAKETGEAVSALVLASGPLATAATRRAARHEAEEAIAALESGLAALDRHENLGA